MPLEKIEYHETRAWGLWRITETEEELVQVIKEYEKIPDQLTHLQKRLEFAAGRVLAKALLEKLGYPFKGVTKNEFGKPYYAANTVQLSLSHSFPYVAALADTTKSSGIDIEQIKTKLVRIAPRILHATEFEDAALDETKLCVYWCAKETLIKVHGKKGLTFSTQLPISPFELQKEGSLTGKIIADGEEANIPLQYYVFDGFVIVLNT